MREREGERIWEREKEKGKKDKKVNFAGGIELAPQILI